MNNDKKDNISINQYALEYSKEILQAVFNGLQEEKAKFGKDFGTSITMTMLASFICNLVYQELKKNSLEITSEDYKMKMYQEYKSLIQKSISMGFQSAFSEFQGSSKGLEFYCQIASVPEPSNKLPC